MSGRLSLAALLGASLLAATSASARPDRAPPAPKAKGRAPKAQPQAASCLPGTPAPGPGSVDPFRAPALKAVELNAAGKAPYREGKWDDARAHYRAAEAADPEFLAPRLNVACSFVRQERFAEATAEVVALLERAYVPWAREILEAADLGALKARPESKQIQAALAASAARWSEGLVDSVVFIARQRAPLRVPGGPGVFILNPHQEVWAFTPRTRRYRQLTVEDGHVVALARTPDGRSLVYVTAEKLVRGPGPRDVSLRGVAVHELSLVTMAAGRSGRLEGDVRRLAVGADSSFEVVGADQKTTALHFDAVGALAPAGFGGLPGKPLVTLTAHGVEAQRELRVAGPCPLVVKQKAGEGGVEALSLSVPGGAGLSLVAPHGAGLAGLPIP